MRSLDINARPKPLALYYFGRDRLGRWEWVLAHTASGGVTVNDIAVHFLADELPFGGVGESGMGAYHGEHRLSCASAMRGRCSVKPGWIHRAW
jgi:coniferyl-aldehyde dehydrogenase